MVVGGYNSTRVFEKYKAAVLEKLLSSRSVGFIEYKITRSQYDDAKNLYEERARLAYFFNEIQRMQSPVIFLVGGLAIASTANDILETIVPERHFQSFKDILMTWRPNDTFAAETESEIYNISFKIKERYPESKYYFYPPSSRNRFSNCRLRSKEGKDEVVMPQILCRHWE